MPTYEYRCRNCDEQLEVVQSFSDDPLTECPACGGELRKVFQAVGIAFKGSGFYKNDSRAAAKSASSTSGSSSEASGSSDGTTSRSAGSNGDKGSGGDGAKSSSSSSSSASSTAASRA